MERISIANVINFIANPNHIRTMYFPSIRDCQTILNTHHYLFIPHGQCRKCHPVRARWLHFSPPTIGNFIDLNSSGQSYYYHQNLVHLTEARARDTLTTNTRDPSVSPPPESRPSIESRVISSSTAIPLIKSVHFAAPSPPFVASIKANELESGDRSLLPSLYL